MQDQLNKKFSSFVDSKNYRGYLQSEEPKIKNTPSRTPKLAGIKNTPALISCATDSIIHASTKLTGKFKNCIV